MNNKPKPNKENTKTLNEGRTMSKVIIPKPKKQNNNGNGKNKTDG
ncbi:hypothetical protein ABIB30_005034 [Pedobacter sp. UYP1]